MPKTGCRPIHQAPTLALCSRPQGATRAELEVHLGSTPEYVGVVLRRLKNRGHLTMHRDGHVCRWVAAGVVYVPPQKLPSVSKLAKPPKPPKVKPATVPQATYGTFKAAAKVDTSRAKYTRHPTPPDRFAHTGPIYSGFASLRPGQYAFEPASCAARAAA